MTAQAVRTATALMLVAALALAGAQRARADTSTVYYLGGPVMHSSNAVLVQWGSSAGTYAQVDENLIQYVAGQSGTLSDPFATLAEYSDGSGAVSPTTTYGGTYTLTPPLTETTVVTEAQVRAALQSAISAGSLPAPAGNGLGTAYFLLFAPGVTVSDDSGHADSGVINGWCASYGDAQASSSGPHVLFAMLPDQFSSTHCGNSGVAQSNETLTMTQVWASMLTSPLVASPPLAGAPTGWYGASQSLGGLCMDDGVNDGGFTVQAQYSERFGECVSTAVGVFSTPSASIIVSSSATSGQSIAFTASAGSTNQTDQNNYQGHNYAVAAGISGYTWNFDDGSAPAAGVTATHTFTTAGTYDVTLTVTDTLGFTATSSELVTVNTPAPVAPPPTPTTTQTTTGCGSGGACSSSCASAGGCNNKKAKAPKVASIVIAGSPEVSRLGGGTGLVFAGGESVKCPRGKTVCVVVFRLVRNDTLLAQGTFTLGEGRHIPLRAALTTGGKYVFKHHSVVVATLTVTVRHGADLPVTQTKNLTLTGGGGG